MFRIFALALVLALSVTVGEASILALSVTPAAAHPFTDLQG